jgi:molybdopterin-containing oxidoreductase family iron-sulfur binding subunit
MSAGRINTLVILGGNPGFTSVPFRSMGHLSNHGVRAVHLGEYDDETSAMCEWHLPQAHFLEAWGDLLGYAGEATIQQPLINPLWGGRTQAELLRFIRTGVWESSYAIVRGAWNVRAGDGSEDRWLSWVRRGTVDGAAPPPNKNTNGNRRSEAPQVEESSGNGLTLLLVPDDHILDGRFSNNAWLQELPRSLTHLVWDNAALVAPALASTLGISDGDMVQLEAGQRTVEAAAYVMQGHAVGCVSLALGFGRTKAGSVGTGHGFDAYTLRPSDTTWSISGLRITRTGAKYPLVVTHGHFNMEGRETVRTIARGETRDSEPKQSETLYPTWPKERYAWGMSINLSTCIGCNACVVACQAENNIPTVGKHQTGLGREMHWIRIDRYFEGAPSNPSMLVQPVPCMQCENAPCELVCPVGATVHSSEGLNDMVYNRCVGTRYCSNNCPYKVRRFNFLDFRSPPESPENLQENPEVTVRARGVMEKCTYCVQRINAGRIVAEKENRRIADGEVRTACQQACPAGAIIFGNIAESSSQVSRLKALPLDYSLLADQNTRPRTTYLARVINGPLEQTS